MNEVWEGTSQIPRVAQKKILEESTYLNVLGVFDSLQSEQYSKVRTKYSEDKEEPLRSSSPATHRVPGPFHHLPVNQRWNLSSNQELITLWYRSVQLGAVLLGNSLTR